MVVPGRPVLVPGTPVPPTFPLVRYRFPEQQGAVRAIIRSTTQPGDLVLAIGAVNRGTVGEVVTAKRRIVALARNPLDLLCTRLSLTPVPCAAAQSALTQLGDQPKAGHPLMLHIRSQYETLCPHCHRSGTAAWFAWDRERRQPFAKRVICPHCEQTRDGPVDGEDIQRAGTYPVSAGPAYHFALSRAAGQHPGDISRVAQLIQLYTPRNLSALMDLIQRLPRLHVDEDVRRVIHGLLLDALDAGSTLVPYETPTARPRSLRTPQRFLERNVWMILEEAFENYRAHCSADSGAEPGLGLEAEDLTDLLVQPERGYVLLNRSIQSLGEHDLKGSLGGLIVQLAPPDATLWALAVLWSLWLWDDSVPDDLRGFLQRRRLDWEWYQRSLAAAIRYAGPFLVPEAPILLSAPTSELGATKAIAYAANNSGLAIDRWIACPPNGYRVLAHRGSREAAWSADGAGATDSGDDAVAAQILRERGEPMAKWALEAAVVLRSRREEVRALDVQTSRQLVDLGESKVWIRRSRDAAIPLADRVEAAAFRRITETQDWTTDALLGDLYGEFHDILSPEPELVHAVIETYALPEADGRLELRPEDDPQRRRAEQQQLRKDLLELGERLGFSSVRRLNGDLVWREEGNHRYVYRLTPSAELGDHLLKSPPRCDGTRCLVLPGGRAALVALKLRRDPRLAQLAIDQNWTFIKFRHLRRMIEEITNRAEIEVFLGLDPIVEKPGAQIPLPLQLEARR